MIGEKLDKNKKEVYSNHIEYRCKECNALLAKTDIEISSVKVVIRCRRCKEDRILE